MSVCDGENYPGGTVGISVNGTLSPVTPQVPASSGRIPRTLVVSVPLIVGQQTVEALWYAIRGSTVIIDSPATLSATY